MSCNRLRYSIPWWLWPLQAFCFNFGSTHGIHHFVVKEPFYIRQMTCVVAHKVMAQMGVRFNDFATFRRANRFAPSDAMNIDTTPEPASN
jgi:hypothetical protein